MRRFEINDRVVWPCAGNYFTGLVFAVGEAMTNRTKMVRISWDGEQNVPLVPSDPEAPMITVTNVSSGWIREHYLRHECAIKALGELDV